MILSTADTAPHETPRSVYKRCKIDPFSFLACFQSTIALHRRSTPTKKKLFSSSSFNQRSNFATHNRLFHPLQFTLSTRRKCILDANHIYRAQMQATNAILERTKYGQQGYLYEDHPKCSSGALTLSQLDAQILA